MPGLGESVVIFLIIGVPLIVAWVLLRRSRRLRIPPD
jgi:hypothetical protein